MALYLATAADVDSGIYTYLLETGYRYEKYDIEIPRKNRVGVSTGLHYVCSATVQCSELGNYSTG